MCKIENDLAFDNKFCLLVHDVVYVLTLKTKKTELAISSLMQIKTS